MFNLDDFGQDLLALTFPATLPSLRIPTLSVVDMDFGQNRPSTRQRADTLKTVSRRLLRFVIKCSPHVGNEAQN